MKRVGTGFSGVVTPLFDNMLVLAPNEVGLIQYDVQSITIPTEPSTSKPHKKYKPKKQYTQAPKVPFPEPSPEHMLPSPSNDPLPVEENRVLKELHSVHSKVDIAAPVVEKEKSFKQGRIIAYIDEDVEINLEAAQAKPYKMDLEHQEKVLSMQDVNDEEPAEAEEVLEVVTAAKLITKVVTTVGATTTTEATKVSVPRRRRGVVIEDPEETTSIVVVHSKVQSKDKEKGILIVEPKSLKGQAQIKQDEAFARQLEAELNADINWNAIMNEIRPLFEKHYNYNQAFPEEVNEEVTVPEKEVKVEGHKREEATPLASKISIVDYKIHFKRNKPYFKIIRAYGNHMLFLSFSTLLKNFNREDLECLWKLVKERFEKTKPKNYTDDYLLKTLKTMFEQPDVEAKQMMSNVRLEVEEESEMSLERLRLVRRQLNEGGGLLGIMDLTYYYCSSYLVLLLGITAGKEEIRRQH
nr:hypothetical protein [Tanacetum cinerariifolium]